MPQYDVTVIGAGVVGSAVARELSRYQLRICVLEKNPDVCMEQSGRNSAVVHGGFAYNAGSLKAACCVEGCLSFPQTAAQLDVPFRKTGKLLVGNTREDMRSLETTLATGRINGAQGLEIVDKRRMSELCETATGEFALYSPNSGIMDPFIYNVALAENACHNGAEFYLEREVKAIQRLKPKGYRIVTDMEAFETAWIINASGQNCGVISEMMGIPGYRRSGFGKGSYFVLDKRTGPLLPMPVYPVPNNSYMGVHVTPTIDGNVIVGPDNERKPEKDFYGVTQERMDLLIQSASRVWPHISKKDYIRNYAGSSARWDDGNGEMYDFVIEAREEAPQTINLINLESPALTGAVPIAKRAVKLLAEREMLRPNERFDPVRRGIPRLRDLPSEEREKLIAQDPDYGEIICRCEGVSKGEVIRAIRNPLNAHTLTGIKWRTRAQAGRCQGGYCQMRIAKIIMDETRAKPESIRLHRPGSYLFTGRMRSDEGD